jgi:DNA-binding SARP family transcriptional activator
LEYLEQEVTVDLAPELREFLGFCSLLQTISPTDCASFEPDPKLIARRIEELRVSNLPLMQSNKDEFVLHPLLREACHEILKRSASEERFIETHRRVAEHYLGLDEFGKAIELYFDIYDYDAALEVVHKYWFKLMASGDFDLVNEWLELIPPDKQSNPCYLETKTRMLSILGHFKELGDFVALHLKSVNLPKGHPVLGTMWLQHRGSLLLTQEGYGYAAVIQDWQEFQKQKGPFDDSVLVGLEEIVGFAAYAELKINESITHMERALNLVPDKSHPNAFRYRTFLATLDFELGRSERAAAELYSLISESESPPGSAIRPVCLLFLIRYLTLSGRISEAADYLAELQASSRDYKTAFDMLKVHSDRYRGLCHFYAGNVEIAVECLKESMEHARASYFVEFANSARIYEYYSYLVGDNVEILPPVPEDPSAPLSEESLHHRLHRVYRNAREEKLQEALKPLLDIRFAVESNGLSPWLVTTNFFASWVEQRLEHEDEARDSLRCGLETLKEIGWRNYPMANSEVTAHVIAAAHRWNLYPELVGTLSCPASSYDLENCVADLLANAKLSAAELTSLINLALSRNLKGLTGISALSIGDNDDNLNKAKREYERKRVFMSPPPLTIRTLGTFSTICEGRRVEYSRAKSKLLFARLLSAHPAPVHEEVLIEDLWPEANEARGRANLRTVVSALRKSLDPSYRFPGRSYVILEGERYFLEFPDESRVDFLDLEALAGRVLNGDETDSALSAQARQDAEAAIALYQGDFLTQLPYEEFVTGRSENLKNSYYKLLERYCSGLLATSDLEKVELAVQAGLGHDPLWARGVAFAMTVYSRSNQLIKAFRTYRRYEATLLSELDISPSTRLQRQFEDLQKS